jgi:hypothetical protein
MANLSMTEEEFVKYDDEMKLILRKFHNALFDLINVAESIDPKNTHVTWVKQQIDIFRKIDRENIIRRLKDKMWDYREQIMNKDLDFFKQNQFSKFIKNDDNRQFMYSIINMLKKKIETLEPEAIEVIWDIILQLLMSCIEYKKLTRDYDE